ncbi:unnamed protein product [Durusdinium trenchii]|uniref:Uncharacterized protein n=2 Tax=Durusdinium trenchii TaxID=1381693 RepID=A0ABP0SLU4_9DINO
MYSLQKALGHVSRALWCRTQTTPAGRAFARRHISESGEQTFANVVKELKKKGKLPISSGGPEFSAAPGPKGGPAGGFVDIDEDLLEEVEESEDAETAESYLQTEVLELNEDVELNEDLLQAERSQALAAAKLARQKAFEEAAQLSEEELRERVKRSIEELVPISVSGSSEETPVDEGELTPAQVFYMENRDRLVSRAQDYYLEKHKELQRDDDDEDEWRYYHDPVMRPAKGHLWSTGMEEDGGEHGQENAWLQVVTDWPRGYLPTAEMLANLLRLEQARDVSVIDLEECDRRDVGTHAIIATGVTARHCRRLGHIMFRATEACEAPFVQAFCYGTRQDEWVVAHCGSIKVHLLTQEAREQYQLELLYRRPEYFFQPGDFPHYVEVYGSATDAMMLNGETHVTHAIGSRSRSALPVPYRDRLHRHMEQANYEGTEDSRYVEGRLEAPVIDVEGSPVVRAAVQREARSSGSSDWDAWPLQEQNPEEATDSEDEDAHEELNPEEDTDSEDKDASNESRKL